jgi:hypothetical protein
MALPISSTPILKGKDSERFNKQLKKGLKSRISKAERKKGIALMKAVLKNAKI